MKDDEETLMSQIHDVRIMSSPHHVAVSVAREIADGIQRAKHAGALYVLGCPSGRSPRSTYLRLAEEIGRRNLPLDHVRIALMDDYVIQQADGRFQYVDSDAHNSCRRFAREEIIGPLNHAAARAMTFDQVLVPDPNDAARYDDELAELGGIDFFLLASGTTDGHVAFNPPGSEYDSRTRVIRLAEQTRSDNLGTFPEFSSIDEVPLFGVSVGVGTIATLSRRAAMILTGGLKRRAFQEITSAEAYDPLWPATVIAMCRNVTVFADPAAAGSIDDEVG